MRTLQTQVRLRRLLRTYGEFADRLADGPAEPGLGEIARARLFHLAEAVHEAWAADSATVAVPALRRHVSRTLTDVDTAIAGLGRHSADPRRLADELQESALALLLMLRGMEDLADRQVLDWIGPAQLARSA